MWAVAPVGGEFTAQPHTAHAKILTNQTKIKQKNQALDIVWAITRRLEPGSFVSQI